MKIKRKNIIWLVVLITIGTVLWLRWDAWFGDLPEPDFTLSHSPQRLFITPGEDGIYDRTFTWVNGKEMPYELTLIRDSIAHTYPSEHTVVETGGGITHLYATRLEELEEGTYTVFVTAPLVNDTLWGSFVIREQAEQNLIFIGDIQDRKETGSGAFLNEIASRFPNMDSWLFVGDLIERPHDQFWKLFYSAVQDIAPHTPFIPVTGNHEYNKGGLYTLGERFVPTFSMPLNGNDGRKGRNYFIDYPSVRIIGLDTNMMLFKLSSTRKWLREALSARADAPFTIVMGHHGVYSVGKGRSNPTMKYGIDPVLREEGADILLQGHDHAYSRNGGPDDEWLTPVYVTGTTSAKHYPVGDPTKHISSLSGERLYSHIRITCDTLYFNTYRENHELFDSFTLIRN